ncbi:MAG: EcsC family protein [Thiohalocapsa sp.]
MQFLTKTATKATTAAGGWAARAWSAGEWTKRGRAAGDDGKQALLAMLRQGFDWAYERAIGGMPGLDGAEQLAARYTARHADADAAVKALINWQSGVAGTAGFATGIGGFVALPVAMPANIASALYIQARLVAAIAHLRGHDLRSDEVRALALACLAGSKAADTARDAGVRLGTRLARDGAGWLSPVLFKKAAHAARAGAPAVCAAGNGAAKLGKLVPVVGGVVAGGFDAAMTQMIGRTADRVFRRLAMPPQTS